ncbi:MAG: hypothetical protein CMA79_00485 [Euryarchaeota archaeon]|nr:hypothetical protein [Euryarchaeota archaeon]MBN54909.1 hypothetical protein [Euryarchaeota archaeon]MEC9458209.1 hypothetical protein [Candidatus Thermoplasmatota archaeon]|tara:strand:- start:4570 stop:5067 length:498 start_codon:yes stop_codon:yes gene_type:complete
MSGDESTARGTSKELEEMYREQIQELMERESNRVISESINPSEENRLQSLSVVELFEKGDSDLVPALMSRLGVVRAALEGHGGALVVTSGVVEESKNGRKSISLILDLDGACVSCGAAPGTLKGIQDDLLAESEISSIRFSSSMLDWFDEIQREFVLEHGGVTFV